MVQKPKALYERREVVARHVAKEAMAKGGTIWFKAKHLAAELGWGREGARSVGQDLPRLQKKFSWGWLRGERWGRCRSTTYKFTVEVHDRARLEEWLWGVSLPMDRPLASSRG